MIDKMAKLTAVVRRLLENRRLPLILAVLAIVFMLPALPTGLLGDDLIQRPKQFTPGELPARLMDTGFVPDDSGKLGTVLRGLFGYNPNEQLAARARDYGIAPWWAHEAWTAALWRPFTAFTHWLDYRLFPNTPLLMHAHNIAWYATAIFLAATAYRKIATAGGGENRHPPTTDNSESAKMQWNLAAAGLAASLFLLDKNTYFPVMYVANRGFIIALVFGLLCLHAHVRWRTTQSSARLGFSAFFLLLSLLANEGGASTLAFLIAYALVLEPGGWRPRLISLLPAAAVMVAWRVVYTGSGFGVKNVIGYIDPGYEPFLFLKNIAPRFNALIGGQLTGLPPELSLALNAKWQAMLAFFFAGFSLVCALVFLPILRRDVVARFWAVVMLLAAVPAATVVPLSKNMGFVAVGAFGFIASFLVRFGAPSERSVIVRPLRAISWCLAIWLVVAHIPGAVAGRIVMALGSRYIPEMAERAPALEDAPEIGGRNVVVINDPAQLPALVPFDRAYRGQPLPASIRILVPGSTRFQVTRTDASSLLLTAKEGDLFDCPAVGPFHLCYVCKAINDSHFGARTWKPGDRAMRKGFMAEIREVSARGAPSAVAFQFDRPLESEDKVWLFFDWRRLTHSPFVLPQVGGTVEIAGPHGHSR
jgi:hypothetical protein